MSSEASLKGWLPIMDSFLFLEDELGSKTWNNIFFGVTNCDLHNL